jgi:hypothetical protein
MLVMCLDGDQVVRDLRSNERAEGSTGWLSGIRKLEVLADGRLLGVLERNGGEGRDGKVGSLGAGLDELGSKGEDSTGLESGVESSGDRLSSCGDTDESLVTGLDGNDRSSGGKDVGGVDQGRGAEVGGDTDGLENTGSLDHGIGAGKSSIKVVLAGLNRLGAGSSNGRDEGRDVSGLGLADAHERLDLARSKTQAHEVGHGELGETLLVELGLEVLSSQSAEIVSCGSNVQYRSKNLQVEDVDIGQTSFWCCRSRGGSGTSSRCGCGSTH